MSTCDKKMSRRSAIGAIGTLGTGAASLLEGDPAHGGAAAKKRYAIVGTGHRGTHTWGRAVRERYPDLVDFVGLCDPNSKRVEVARKMIGVDCPTFTDFDEMCRVANPTLLAVTTIDSFHSQYIIKALDRGIDVLTEKPMVIDEKQCRDVLEAERRNKRKITVTFNMRYSPLSQRVKEMLLTGEVGPLVAVAFNYYLDTRHGADYFRRWHRLQSKSGSLLCHKSTHHFDVINWWLDADPVEVAAFGRLAHYGKQGPFRHTHCRTCPHKGRCPYYWDITKSPSAMQMYVGPESVDGYHRDGCVFRPDSDSFDTMSALVRYSNGVNLNYSLNMFMPFEGYQVMFTGQRGTLEVRYGAYDSEDDVQEIYLTKRLHQRQKVEVPVLKGTHGGSDDRLGDVIFRNSPVPAHMRLPGSREGALSCMLGVAARKSIKEGHPIKIADLVKI